MAPSTLENLVSRMDPLSGEIVGAPTVRRHLSDMRDCYHDAGAYAAALSAGNVLVYTVASVEPGVGEGDLHYGLGRIMPGRVGDEYFMTRGHLHSWRAAAEVYVGLQGEGLMLLEAESASDCVALPLKPNQVVYVPGHTAHRTANTGTEPLTYLGIYPARAGHDYAVIGERNFSHLLVERNGRPVLLSRAEVGGAPASKNRRHHR